MRYRVDAVIFIKPKDWRASLQTEIDANNALRSGSITRVGDAKTEYPASSEGAGRVREIAR